MLTGFEFTLVLGADEKIEKNWWEEQINELVPLVMEKQQKVPSEARISFSLSIVSEKVIGELNQAYRKIEGATDVLSFSSFEQIPETLIKEALVNKIPLELGDIFICEKKIALQAYQYGHSIFREARFLFTHGFLHLLGYDHQTKKAEEEMFTLQKAILNLQD